jgi:hypothetical protein
MDKSFQMVLVWCIDSAQTTTQGMAGTTIVSFEGNSGGITNFD